ncbi:MAG: YebC/PmpR family DNA-binding transcriptional regulator [Patescibacteria group bacterium]
MAGHNKWKQIKEKKGATDAKRSKLFTKYAKLIRVEARLAKGDINSPMLRAAIENAKAAYMPKENIERAVASAMGAQADEKVLYEAYGPGGCALIITGLTDNNNRTVQEIKHLLSEHNTSLGTQGSVMWAFTKNAEGGYTPNNTVTLSEDDEEKLGALMEDLHDHDDIQDIYTNAA